MQLRERVYYCIAITLTLGVLALMAADYAGVMRNTSTGAIEQLCKFRAGMYVMDTEITTAKISYWDGAYSHTLDTTAAHGGIVPSSRTVNGKALSSNITLTAADVGADTAGTTSAHAGLTTTAHGGIVADTDARLSDNRTPTAHTQSYTTISGLGTASTHADTEYAQASHNQAWNTITGTPTTIGGYGITDAVNTDSVIAVTKGGTGSTTAAAAIVAIGGKAANGFVDRTNSTLGMSGSNFQVTTTGSYDIYAAGTKYTKSTTQQVSISTDKTLHYVYFDTAGAIQVTTAGEWSITSDNVPVATVYKDGSFYCVSDERHGWKRDRDWHKWAHETIGARWHNGLYPTFADTTLSVTSGEVDDEDLHHPISSNLDSPRVWYRNSTTSMRVTATSGKKPYLSISGTDIAYDAGGTPTQVDNNKYACVYLYATNDQNYPLYIVAGQAQHATIAAARSDALPTIQMSTAEWKLLARAIYKSNGASAPTYQEMADYRNVSNGPALVATATDHQSLINRDAANAHPQAAITGLTTADTPTFAGLTITNAMAQSQVQNLTSDLAAKVAGPAASVDSEFMFFSGTGGKTAKAGGVSMSNMKTQLSLNNVENTALSSWAGSSSITTIGTISSGTVPQARVSGLTTTDTPTFSGAVITNSVGIGTAAPGKPLTVYGGASYNDAVCYFKSQNTTNGQSFGLLVDAGVGASDEVLRIRSQNGNTDYMIIKGNGNVGIGTAAPTHKLVSGNGTTTDVNSNFSVIATGASEAGLAAIVDKKGPSLYTNGTVCKLGAYNWATNAYMDLVICDGGGNVGIGTASPGYQLELSTNSAAKPSSEHWTTTSDERLKQDIREIDSPLETLLQLKGRKYKWKPSERGKHQYGSTDKIGFIAQEVETVFPEWVGTAADGTKNITTAGMDALIIEAIRELKTENEALKKRIEFLEAKQ